MSGTEGAAETERALRERFEELGYETRELPFSFSSWPGRFGLPASGLAVALTGAGAAVVLRQGLPVLALIIVVVGLGVALLPLLLLDHALDRLSFGRLETRNLLFARPGTRPSWIVMAHRDTKSQIIPTLVRTGAIATAAAGCLVLLGLSVLWLAGDPFRFQTAALLAGVLVALSGIVLALAWSSNDSPGALDNASGLAAVLAVAGGIETGEVAFLITDGEELGLAGARSAIGQVPAVEGVINVDGLDDRGVVRVAEGHGWRRRGSAPQLAAALLTAGRALDIDVRRRPLPRSMMVDHQPIAASGLPALTVVRGGWRSLLRVHRPTDSVERLQGRGAAEAATLLTAAFRILRANKEVHLAAGRARGS